METGIDILNELKQLGPHLATIDRSNIFTVPDGYFEALAANILYTIQAEESRLAVPEGYFDSLAASIMQKIKGQVDNEPLSPLLESLRKVNVFTVPEGYFDRPETIAAAMTGSTTGTDAETPLLKSLRDSNVFAVPESYFDALPEQVLQRVQAEEVVLSPQLAALQGINVYELPGGYFDGLAGTIVAKVRPSAKVVSLRSRIVKLAAAAVVTGMMALGIYKYVQPAAAGTLTTVQQRGVEIAGNAMRYDNEMNNLSDEEIVKFLETSGTDVDAALVAASADEKELPGEEDYLLDEHTLENFLNGDNNKNLDN